MKRQALSYQARVNFCHNPIAKKLLNIMAAKKTNLALSADLNSGQELIEFAEQLGPEICVLKTHIDMIDDFTPALTRQLAEIADKHEFLIFEDRKFADIGNTVKHQYGKGIFRIADWAHMVNAHVLPGPGIIEGLASVGKEKQRSLILLAEMSSAGHLMDADYVAQTLMMAKDHSDFVIGFVTQHNVASEPHWINFTPGVKLSTGGDALGQQYVTPELAIIEHGADVIIVGRGILQAKDPLAEAIKYREAGWKAYLRRM